MNFTNEKEIIKKFKQTPYNKPKPDETLEQRSERLSKKAKLFYKRYYDLVLDQGLRRENEELADKLDTLVDYAAAEANDAGHQLSINVSIITPKTDYFYSL